MRKKFTGFMILFLLSVCMLGNVAGMHNVQAASAKLSATKKTIYVNNSFTLQLKNYSGKKAVKWKTSNKSVASLKKQTKTKYKITGKKAGKATITAKAGKKTYKCVVTVNSLENHTHDYKYVKKVYETCTTSGYDLYKCSCGETKKENIQKAYGHHASDSQFYIVKEPTENKKGIAQYACWSCGKGVGKKKKISFKDLYTYEFRDGGAVITEFDSNYSGSIHIPSEIKGKQVTSIGEWAFNCSTLLKSVDIPDGVTEIGYHAFSDCYLLESVDIPDSVTEIWSGAFFNCSNLKSITIPNGVTSIEFGAFQGCTRLKNIDLPDSVTKIEQDAFYYCSSLKSITLPDGVTSIGKDAFSWCENLKSITIPDSVTSIGKNAFQHCDKLVIKGSADSYAKKYAKKYGYKFEEL